MTEQALGPFGTGDLVQVETDAIRAVGRVRESDGGRLHIALEKGEYLPWVDADVQIRHFGDAPERAQMARILHVGATTALLQLVEGAQVPAPVSTPRAPFDTIPDLEV